MKDREKDQLFKEIYETWVTPLFNFLFYKTGDQTIAEDLVHDVFANFWKKMHTIEKSKVKSYLYTSAKNMVINNMTKQNVVLKFEQQLEHKKSESPQYILEVKEFKNRLELAISQLTEAEREVFLMHRIDGFKYREIAEIIGVSQKAIEKRMHNALVKLRKICNKI
ncbi:MAG: RNA polymerase sigma factor [Saprospiraceae bacterium]|nr:RNA polymerase sigma factor [Bacteroidia bacterium]NNE14662.1 RNA polymerase sigma factor [Saprospiraceae bacterium]NNL91851.1 RNA polymerase sigma factor [Saprospiraceae bacterium]